MEWEREDFVISDDLARIDLDVVCRLLAGSYWAASRPRETIRRSIENSIALGLYHGGAQIGFARLVTDRATFAWIADVIIDPPYRGGGLGKWLAECAVSHPAIQGTRQLLLTRDAH